MNIDESEVRQRLSRWVSRLEATGLAERRKKKATAIALIVIDVLRETEEALSLDLLIRRVQDRMAVRAAEDGVRSVVDALATQPNSAVRYESGTLRWDPDGSVPALPVRPTDTLLSTRTAAAILEFASERPGIELSVDELQVGIGDLLGRRLSESGVRRAAETIANSKDFDFIQLSANGFVWEPRLQRSAEVSTDSTKPGRLIAGLLNFATERGSMGFRVAEAVDSFAAKHEATVDESAVRRLLKALGRRKDIPLVEVERDRYLITGRGTSDHSVELHRSTLARDISVPAHVVEMIEMRRGGASLDEVGQRFGLTRERVRQLMVQHGGPSAKEVRELLRQKATEAAVASVRQHLSAGVPITAEDLAVACGLDVATVNKVWPSDLAYLRVHPGARVNAWSDSQILESIREAALYEFPLTTNTYRELAAIGQISGPSVPTIYNRFGSWVKACDAAGVEAHAPLRSHYDSRWTDSELAQVVRRYLLDPEAPNVVGHFDEWVSKNVPDGPSSGTIRKRLGPWSEAKTIALALGDPNVRE